MHTRTVSRRKRPDAKEFRYRRLIEELGIRVGATILYGEVRAEAIVEEIRPDGHLKISGVGEPVTPLRIWGVKG